MRHLRPQGIFRVRIGQKGQNRQEHLRNRQSRRPLIFQDVQADHTARVDIRVIDLRLEIDFWGLKGIIRREVDGELKDTAGKR